MDLWLIRTQRNEIAGPYSRDRLLEILKTGSLNFRDELCRANEEWFCLSETEEVRRRLGQDVPELLRAALRKNSKSSSGAANTDLTEDRTEEVQAWMDDITEPGLGVDRSQVQGGAASPGGINPWFGEGNSTAQGVESTRVLKGNAKEPSPSPRNEPILSARNPTPPKVEVAIASVPENSIFRALGLTLALLALVAVYWVFRILRSE